MTRDGAIQLAAGSDAEGDALSVLQRQLGRYEARWLKAEELDSDFFAGAHRAAHPDDEREVLAVRRRDDIVLGHSILTALTLLTVERFMGIFPYQLGLGAGSGRRQETVETVVKIKPLDEEIVLMTATLAGMCDQRMGRAFARFKDQLGFTRCHSRELAVYRQRQPRFDRYLPALWGTVEDDERKIYALILERLIDVELLDCVDRPGAWSQRHLEVVLRDLAELHAVWYQREDELLAQPWLGPVPNREDMAAATDLWQTMAEHGALHFPAWFSERDLARHFQLIEEIEARWSLIESLPRTLVHNDFNPRNLALRRTRWGLRLCAYDWELATLHLPQHDLAHFLGFVLDPDTTLDELEHYSEIHRLALARSTGTAIPVDSWRLGVQLSLRELLITRFAGYCVAHTFQGYEFMERIYRTIHRLLDVSAPWAETS